MRKIRLLILSVLLLAACRSSQDTNNSPAPPTEIIISAAASLQNAFREIGAVFEKQNNIKANFNFAASGTLQTQIEAGAPVDIFASAGKPQMNQLAEKGLIVPETRRDFLQNELVLIVPNNFLTKSKTFEQFVEDSYFKIAIGNPKTVPAGVYAEQTLRKLNVWDKLQPRLVFGEDVRQVLQYVERGETDGGIVYVSDAKAANGKVHIFDRAPENSHEPILYPIAIVKNSQHQVAAQQFIELVLSREGQAILQKHGFTTVNGLAVNS